MANKMNAKEIRQMSDEEINSSIAKLKEELFNLRFQLATGGLTDTARIKKVKRSIARFKTIQSEKARA